MNEKNYTKGFNDGYLLSKHEPELAKKILASPKDKDNDYLLGFKNGHKQHEKEKFMEQMKKGKQKDRQKEKEE